ncbi:MAG TPA: tRNA preQ1(34) S-adenosylmethionine ribosyltransferase-isomerase QueA, partial [Vicinamibacterales bacterium]|nr:tRNA preQ1(34) S-adenosylmethionine ribosyltransferase-isomerase QueA [Vicinamibacterales bacterium]
MLTSAFDFDLPGHLIAQHARPRGTSRLMVVDRAAGSWHEATIGDLPGLLAPGDVLVANDTRVFPARLLGRRDPSGGAVECLLLEREGDDTWQALVHPGQKLQPGTRIVFDDPARAPGVRLRGEILERRYFGRRLVRFEVEGSPGLDAAVDALGHIPLPPYIDRPDTPADRDRYQTVFARARGSVAAPTAGLHFSDALIERLAEGGVGWATVTLQVGYGTFKPVRAEQVEDHVVDPEWFEIPRATIERMAAARAAGHRVVAVGTTTTRALETWAATGQTEGAADLFIYPGFRLRAIDGLLTNFHLPR